LLVSRSLKKGKIMAKTLKEMSIKELKTELKKRQSALPKLRKQRAKLIIGIRKIDAQIAAIEGTAPAKGPKKRAAKKTAKKAAKKAPAKRAKKKVARKRRTAGQPSLIDMLVSVLKANKSLSVADATKAVLAAGYKSKSKIFRTIVSQTLSRDKKFKNVKRGVYALK